MKIGIYGYGNLGRGVEYSVSQNPDAEVRADILMKRYEGGV